MWHILKEFYPKSQKIMMSWDSQKIRFFDTGRGKIPNKPPCKPAMTIRHHDIYEYGGDPLDRIQAMLMMQHQTAIIVQTMAPLPPQIDLELPIQPMPLMV
jgi:hypothetical protein